MFARRRKIFTHQAPGLSWGSHDLGERKKHRTTVIEIFALLFQRCHYPQLLARCYTPHRAPKARKSQFEINHTHTWTIRSHDSMSYRESRTKGTEYDSEWNQVTRCRRDGVAMNHVRLVLMKQCGCDAARYLPAQLYTARRQGQWRWFSFSVYMI